MEKSALVSAWLLEHGKTTQAEAARALGVSLSTVNRTVKTLEAMGAVKIGRRSLRVTDAEKVLMHLANERKPFAYLVYRTRATGNTGEIEGGMPAGAEFTAYSAFKRRFGNAPADYSEVYVYADEETLEEIRRRFPPRAGPPNLFVLRKEAKTVVSNALVFADLWNLREWYSKDFVRDLRDRILERSAD